MPSHHVPCAGLSGFSSTGQQLPVREPRRLPRPSPDILRPRHLRIWWQDPRDPTLPRCAHSSPSRPSSSSRPAAIPTRNRALQGSRSPAPVPVARRARKPATRLATATGPASAAAGELRAVAQQAAREQAAGQATQGQRALRVAAGPPAAGWLARQQTSLAPITMAGAAMVSCAIRSANSASTDKRIT